MGAPGWGGGEGWEGGLVFRLLILCPCDLDPNMGSREGGPSFLLEFGKNVSHVSSSQAPGCSSCPGCVVLGGDALGERGADSRAPPDPPDTEHGVWLGNRPASLSFRLYLLHILRFCRRQTLQGSGSGPRTLHLPPGSGTSVPAVGRLACPAAGAPPERFPARPGAAPCLPEPRLQVRPPVCVAPILLGAAAVHSILWQLPVSRVIIVL